jgi:hypothetical protein
MVLYEVVYNIEQSRKKSRLAQLLGWRLSFVTSIKNQNFSVASEKLFIHDSQLLFELSFLYKLLPFLE